MLDRSYVSLQGKIYWLRTQNDSDGPQKQSFWATVRFWKVNLYISYQSNSRGPNDEIIECNW